MLHVAEKVFDDMVNRLLMHLKESKIIDSILKESVRTLPDGTDIKEIKEKIDEIIYLNINQELRMQIQTCEKMQIENFFDNVVNAECFELFKSAMILLICILVGINRPSEKGKRELIQTF